MIFIFLDLILKGFGCFKAARNNQVNWFVAILIFNTGGILPLLYLKFFQKDKNKETLISR